eukprot:9470582-Pyramimonas_sp.AAC.3
MFLAGTRRIALEGKNLLERGARRAQLDVIGCHRSSGVIADSVSDHGIGDDMCDDIDKTRVIAPVSSVVIRCHRMSSSSGCHRSSGFGRTRIRPHGGFSKAIFGQLAIEMSSPASFVRKHLTGGTCARSSRVAHFPNRSSPASPGARGGSSC